MATTRNPGQPYSDFQEQDLITITSNASVNTFDIYCPQVDCRSKILLGSTGTLVQRPKSKLSVPKVGGAVVSSIEDEKSVEGTANSNNSNSSTTQDESETEKDAEELQAFWKVEDMMAFENIGFSRRLPNQVQLLFCSDCDTGPLGYHVAATGPNATKEYLIALDRVRYKSS